MAIVNYEELRRQFTYHAPKSDQPERYEAIRGAALKFAETVYACCPECADTSAAIRKIREAVMTANAAIALEK